MYQDNPELPLEEEAEVFDAENEESPPPFHAEGEPSQEIEDKLDEFYLAMVADDNYFGQECKGNRVIIVVKQADGEEPDELTINGKEASPKEVAEALWEARKLFGNYSLAVDEYKDKSKKMWAISQAIAFKDKDLTRTVTSVRLSAAREIYGYLVNLGVGDRFSLLETAKSPEEKKALESPIFFHANRGYED